MAWCLGCLLPTTCASLLSPLSHSLATLGGPLLAPAGFYSHGRKVCLSTVEEPSLACHQKLQAHNKGDQGAVQVTQDKYCPFVSAECRAQRTEEVKIKIIIIILITYTEWEEGKVAI